MPKSSVYLAGQMRGLPNFGFDRFDRAKEILINAGWPAELIISPADMDRQLGFNPMGLSGSDEELAGLEFDTKHAMRRDIEAIVTQCSTIALLSGWERSQGAQKEKVVGDAIGCRFLYVDPESGLCSDLPVRDASSENILQEAERLVYGDRQRDYGHPIEDFSRTAQIWSALFGIEVRPEQVPLAMIGVKLSREVNRPKRDNVTDLAGYAATLELVRERLGGW